MRKKTYRQNCSLAYSSDLLGERWTLLIFRELLIKPCRFNELNQYLHGMGSNLLSARLKELEAEMLIEKELPQNKRSAYQLTDLGWQIEPIVLTMIRWGLAHGSADESYLHYHHWDLLAMKALFNPGKCKQPLVIQFDTPEFKAWIRVAAGSFSFRMGEADSADQVIPLTIQGFRLALEQDEYAANTTIQSLVDCFEMSNVSF